MNRSGQLTQVTVRLVKRASVFVIAVLITSCASPKEKGVRIGMEMAEVAAVAGPPSRKKKFKCKEGWKNCIEIWQYDGYNVSFSDGVVDATQ